VSKPSDKSIIETNETTYYFNTIDYLLDHRRTEFSNKKGELASFAKNGKSQKTLTNYSYEWIDTEVKYSDSTGKGIIIQNSLPRGGPYDTPTGKRFGYGIFWTRVINETATPFELTINFPADSFAIFLQPDSYLKLFLPPGTMTVDKESLYEYGYGATRMTLAKNHCMTMVQQV
jgi:hypothetical protein